MFARFTVIPLNSTTLACAAKSSVAHYMVAVSGRAQSPLAPYHPFGSEDLAAPWWTPCRGLRLPPAITRPIVAASILASRARHCRGGRESGAVYGGTLAIGGPAYCHRCRWDDVLMQRLSFSAIIVKKDRSNGTSPISKDLQLRASGMPVIPGCMYDTQSLAAACRLLSAFLRACRGCVPVGHPTGLAISTLCARYGPQLFGVRT